VKNYYGKRDEFHWQEEHLDIGRLFKGKTPMLAKLVNKVKEVPRGEVDTLKASFIACSFE
jgi:hypothetical protein